MEIEIISADDLLKKNLVDLNCKTSEFAKKTFWYYTSVDTASKVLDKLCFYVSNLGIMNDLDEAQLHSADKDRVHALCFCNSNTEKIPMWYLYAGLAGKGAAVGFTPSVMLEFLNSIDEIYVVDKKSFEVDKSRVLKKGTDFDFKFGWVYYRDSDQSFNYKNNWYEISVNDYSSFMKENYFVKNYPWEYEKEFRIVFVNRTGIPVERLAVGIPQELLPKLKICLAPEIDDKTVDGEVMNKPGFKKYLKAKLSYSKLDIKMDLFKRNLNDVQEFVIGVAKMDHKRAKRIYDAIEPIIKSNEGF